MRITTNWLNAAAALVLAAAPLLCSGIAGAQDAPGVTAAEIRLGTVQDQSGPLVSVSTPLLNGMNFRIDKANAEGGVHGRKIKLLVEDSAFDPKKAVLASQKLVHNDKIFAMVGTTGTALSVASTPTVIEAGIPFLFPTAASRDNFEPFDRLKFALLTPYDIETRAGLKEMLKGGKYKRIAIFYQDDAFGQEVLRATENVVAAANLPLVEKVSYKRGATDFASQAQRLKSAEPDLIVVASAVRETIAAVTQLRQLEYAGDFLGTQGTFHKDVASLGGKPLEGFYAVSGYPMMYRDAPDNSAALNTWMDDYKSKYGREPDQYSATGWVQMDLFIKAAEAAGPKLTVDSLVSALEKLSYPQGILGNPGYTFSPTKRLGAQEVRISQVKDGVWRKLVDSIRSE